MIARAKQRYKWIRSTIRRRVTEDSRQLALREITMIFGSNVIVMMDRTRHRNLVNFRRGRAATSPKTCQMVKFKAKLKSKQIKSCWGLVIIVLMHVSTKLQMSPVSLLGATIVKSIRFPRVYSILSSHSIITIQKF
uniref:Uncharacterized protein n=1 Tax=Trichogramma kaykai TaxID=54128 RepID=A0ABD2WRM4_9HYME